MTMAELEVEINRSLISTSMLFFCIFQTDNFFLFYCVLFVIHESELASVLHVETSQPRSAPVLHLSPSFSPFEVMT